MPQLEAAGTALRMTAPNAECTHLIQYRGRAIEVTFLPDEDGCTPSEPNKFEVTPEQAEAWARGEWWYHHVLMCAVDAEGEPLELGSIPSSASCGRLPSFMDHTGLIRSICDEICNELDAQGIPKTAGE